MAALRQAERLAIMVRAGDVVATICGNQANVAMMQHRHDQALQLAERSVELQEESGTPHGLGIALASLGQISVRLGSLRRAEQALNRALDVRSPLQFMRETTGAVFDTLAQIHLVRGNHEDASRALQRSREAYGDSSRWYQWSVQALEARLALRRGDAVHALATATQIAHADGVPTAYATQAELIAVGALLAAGRPTDAYHDLGQSVSVFELLGEKYQAGLSHLELGKLAGAAGARSRATRYLSDARAIFESLDAQPDLRETQAAMASISTAATGAFLGSSIDGDAALVRRIVDAAVSPALLAREGTTTLLEACDGQAAVIFTQPRHGEVHVVAAAGCDPETARTMAGAAARSGGGGPASLLTNDTVRRDGSAPRPAAVSARRPLPPPLPPRFRTPCAG